MLKLFNFFCKELKKKKNIRKELKLWKLKESEVKKMFAKKVNKRCDGNEDWHGLQNRLLDAAT